MTTKDVSHVIPLIARNVNVNQKSTAGASLLEIWLVRGWNRSSDGFGVALLLTKAGASTTFLTSTQSSLFDSLTYLLRADRISLIKAFLKADISFQQDCSDLSTRLNWTGVWHSAGKELWTLAKEELIEVYSQPKIKEFHECALLSLRSIY